MKGGGANAGMTRGLSMGYVLKLAREEGGERGYPIPVNSLLCANAVVFFFTNGFKRSGKCCVVVPLT